jgi:ATPase subunit of ABC transporter with duplicated ATPase domains
VIATSAPPACCSTSPPDHLDVESLEVLQAALSGCSGALVVATHDRRLAEGLRLDREVASEGAAELSRAPGRGV